MGQYVSRMTVAGVLIALTLASVGAIGPTRSAEALDLDSICGTLISYEFVDTQSHSWSTSLKNTVNSGADVWERARDYTGSKVIDIDENPNSTWEIMREDEPGGVAGARGAANCTAEWIELNGLLSGNALQDTAAHEIGHGIGLHHTGESDAQDGRIAIMSGCVGLSTINYSGRTFSQDDAGWVRNIYSAAGGIHANIGFERSPYTLYWGFFGSHSKLQRPGHHGSASLGWKPLVASPSPYVYQTMRVNYESGTTLTPRASLKRQSPGTVTGGILVQSLSRSISYGTIGAGDCNAPWPNGFDQNDIENVGMFILRTGVWYKPVTTTWVNKDYGSFVMPSGDEALDVRKIGRASCRGRV